MVVAVRRPRIPQMLAQGMRPPPKPRSPFGNGASVWGGMPSYIANAVKDEPMAPMGGDFEALMAELNASAPKPKITVRPPTDAPYTDNSGYAMPEGGVTEAEMMSAPVLPNGGWAVEPKAQEQQRSPALDIFSQKYEKPKPGWGDALGLVGGALMDLDGTLGSGNMARAQGMMQQRADESRAEFEQRRQEQIIQLAAQGDETALAYLDPIGANREKKLDRRYEREWNREEGRYETEQERLARLEARGILESDRSHMLAVNEYGLRKSESESNGGAGGYGLNGVWGWDQASNKPVFMQPSKSGGLRAAEIPDGVELLDPYNTAFDRKLGTIAADAEGAKTPALIAVEAAEADMARLSQQIDLAITQTDGTNTGFWGQFNFGATDLNATLKTIRASGAFTSLVNLKAQGGTLGALSDTELQLLEAKIANVERSQSQEQIDKNLLELKNALQGATTRIRAAYEKEYAAGRYGRSGANGVPPMLARPGATPARVGPSGQPPPPGFE